MSTNATAPPERDLETCLAYAQVSFMLVESLMLELVARGILSRSALVELIEAAAEGTRPRAQLAAFADSRELLRDDLKVALIGKIANSIAAADTSAASASAAAVDASAASASDAAAPVSPQHQSIP